MGATNCPETPRQKMITMMYLVYTAMLALNVSAQVVDGFKTVGSAMTKSNENLQVKLDDTYANFAHALENSKDKVQADYDKAMEVKRLSTEMGDYIDSLKYVLMAKISPVAEVRPDKKNPKQTIKIKVTNEDKTANIDSIKRAIEIDGFHWIVMDELHESTNLFSSEVGKGGKGAELKAKIQEYKRNINKILGEDSVNINIALNVDSLLTPDNKLEAWEVVNFEEVVSGSSLVTLTRLKAETMNTEFDAVNTLYKHVSKGDFSFDQIALISRPKSTYIIKGGIYETDINVAAYDSRQKFNATVNGQQLISNDSGSVHYRTVCNSIGQQKVNVTAYVTSPDGGTKEYTYSDSYFVAEPVGVISLDNMQVMYSGIENPLTASVPGVDGRNVEVSIIEGQGKLNKVEGNGKYTITPATGCKKIVLAVDAAIEKGKKTRMNTLTFKVKSIPAPTITVAGFKNGDKVSRKSLASGITVTARAQEGFEFKIPKGSIRVIGLEFSVGNKAPYNYNGNTVDPDGLSAVRNASRGDKVYVTAKVMMPDGVPQSANCILTITK